MPSPESNGLGVDDDVGSQFVLELVDDDVDGLVGGQVTRPEAWIPRKYPSDHALKNGLFGRNVVNSNSGSTSLSSRESVYGG